MNVNEWAKLSEAHSRAIIPPIAFTLAGGFLVLSEYANNDGIDWEVINLAYLGVLIMVIGIVMGIRWGIKKRKLDNMPLDDN